MVISGSNWECYEPCPANQYYKHSVWDCLNCHASCATCFYDNTVAHCATCAAGMSKFPGTNYCRVPSVCPLGTYRDATRNCVPCPGGSQHCTTGGLHIGSFTPYSSVTNGVQTACTAPCATCSPAPTDCLSCTTGMLVGNRCFQKCNSGFYDPVTGSCGPAVPTSLFSLDASPTSIVDCASNRWARSGPVGTCQLKCQPWETLTPGVGCTSVDPQCSQRDAANVCTKCKQHYYLTAAKVCAICHKDCLDCTGPGSSLCLNCHPAFTYHPGNSTCGTECGITLFFSLIPSPGCYPCHSTCASCSGPGATKCTSCSNTRVLEAGICHLACAKGTFYNSISKLCQPCNLLCEECLNDPDNCLSCKPNIQLTGATCAPVVCHANCATCNGPLDTDCTATNTPNFYSDVNNAAIANYFCSAGFFPDPANNNACTACSPECSFCLSLGRDQCQKCAQGYFMYNGYCVQTSTNTCLIFTGEAIVFGTPDTCEPCASLNCEFCDKPLKKCSKCKVGFRPDASGDCEACTANTRYCHQETGNSLACNAGYEIINNACVKICRAGQYRQSATCSDCHTSCQECYDLGADRCLSCLRHDEKYPLNGGWGCRAGKQPGYYIGSVPCTRPCNSCTVAVTQCTSCLTGFYLTGNTCTECPVKCAACSDALTCTACFEGFTLSGGDCVPSCTGAEFQLAPNSPCLICNSNCLTCDPAVPDGSKCLTCYQGTYLEAATNKCLSCHWSCETCSDDTNVCLTCKKELTLQGDSTCLLQCAPGLYRDEGRNVCRICQKYCKTCDGPSSKNCLTCVNLDFELRPDGFCQRKCLDTQYYTHDGLNECRDCHPSCGTCSGPFENQCLSCPESYFLVENFCSPCNHWCQNCNGPTPFHCTNCGLGHYLSNNFCKFDCGIGSGTSLVTNRCFVCHPWCQTCSGVTFDECLSCYAGYTLLPAENFCKIDCTIYQFWEREPYNRCLTCLTPCSQCSGPAHTDCLVCDSGYNLVNGLCVSVCGAGQARLVVNSGNDTITVCRNCATNCATCVNFALSRCLTCPVGFSLSSTPAGLTTCVAKCLPGYLWSAFYNQCRPCWDKCEVCSGIGEFQCSKCFGGQGVYLLSDGSCKPAAFCPSDRFYPDNPTGKCLPCYQRCLGCVGTGRYNCTACQPNHYLFKGTCIPNCPVGYFYSQDLDDCILCHPTCKYCVNPKATSCTACYNTGVNKGWLNKDRTCTMPCKDNYYMAPDQRCKICDQSCALCTGPSSSDCTYCSGLNYMTPDVRCKPMCPLRYFKFPPLKVCKDCFSRCETCKSELKDACITCIEPTSNFLTKNTECIHCLTEYEQDETTCHFAQGIWIVTPKTTNMNNKASTTIRITFNYEKKFTKRLSGIDWSGVFSVAVDGFSKEEFNYKNVYREGEILIDLYFRKASKEPVAVKVTPVDEKRLLLIHPSTSLHELLLKKTQAFKLMIPTIAPDLEMLEKMEKMKGESEYYASFFAQFTLVLSAVVIVGQSPLGAPLMKFFRIFKMLSRFKLINIFFGAYLEIFLNIAGMLFKFGDDPIKNPEIRVTPFSRGKLNKYLLTTINTETLAIKYIIYYFTLLVRVYQAKIREYARMHHLSLIDQIVDNIADKSRVIILTIVGVDVLFYTMHALCHIDIGVPQTRDSQISYWVGMVTLMVIVFDVCSLIKQNIDCRFKIVYQLLRKDALIIRKFRADGEVHPIEKKKIVEPTEEELEASRKNREEDEKRKAECENEDELMMERLKKAREGNMDAYAWMMNGYLVRRYDKEEEAEADGGQVVKSKKVEEEMGKRLKKFYYDRKMLQGERPPINPSAELFFSESIKYKSLKTFCGKYYNTITLTKVLVFEPMYVTLQMLPSAQISLIFLVQFGFLAYILWGGLKHKMFVSKVNLIQVMINEVAISIFLFVGLYIQLGGGEGAMSPKTFVNLQLLAIIAIGVAFLIGAFDIFYSVTLQIVIYVKTRQLRTYKKNLALEKEEKDLVKYKDKNGEIVVQANSAKDQLKKLPRVELLQDVEFIQEIKQQHRQAEAVLKPPRKGLGDKGKKTILGTMNGLKNVRKMRNGVSRGPKDDPFNAISVDIKNPEIEVKKEKIFDVDDILHLHASDNKGKVVDLEATEGKISIPNQMVGTVQPKLKESGEKLKVSGEKQKGFEGSFINIDDAQPSSSKKD
jgi:hypothetical protein